MSNESPAVYLGLGSNLGDRVANLREALRRLSPLARPEEVSSLYETAPVGEEEQPAFYNAVCRIVTALEPQALLRQLKDIEIAIGRRPGPRWGRERPGSRPGGSPAPPAGRARVEGSGDGPDRRRSAIPRR